MLEDDASSNMNPSMAAKPVVAKKESAQSPLPPIQIDVANQRLENQGRLQPMQHDQTTCLMKKNDDNGLTLVNFGWEQIVNGPLLPFINRESIQYVSWYIVIEKVFKIILTIFSSEMISCMPFRVLKMNKSEAMTFNEINICHCDGGLAGKYVFTKDDPLLELEDTKKYVEYFHACRNSMICGLKDNNLFGFIQVDGETEVPFIWEDRQKLVPLFYFDGIDAAVLHLTDPWKLGYFKFCFKLQKIRRDLYKNNYIKVIDFQDVEKLFPAEATFELCWPKTINQELLAPAPQDQSVGVTVPPGVGGAKKRSADPTREIKAKQSRLGSAPSQLSAIHIESDASTTSSQVQRDILQTTYQLQHQAPVQTANQVQPPHSGLHIEQPARLELVTTRTSTNPQEGNTQHNQNLATITLVSQAGSKQPNIENNPQASNNNLPTKNLQQLAIGLKPASITPNAHSRFYTNRSVEDDLISNVPRRSPQVATSPGVRQTSPFMVAADELTQRHMQSSITSTVSPNDPVQQTSMFQYNYPPQPAPMLQGQFNNHGNYQRRDGTVRNSSDRSAINAQRTEQIIQHQHLVQQTVSPRPVLASQIQNSPAANISVTDSRAVKEYPNSSKTSKTICYQAEVSRPLEPHVGRHTPRAKPPPYRFPHVPNVPVINTSSNSSRSIDYQNRVTSGDSFFNPSEARIQQSPPQYSVPHVDHSSKPPSSLTHRINNSSTSEYQQGTLPAGPLEADIRKLADEQTMLTESLKQNRHNLRLLKRMKSRQQKKNYVSKSNNDQLPENNIEPGGSSFLSVSTNVQNVSQPTAYQQEYIRTVAPVVQNVNVAVTNVLGILGSNRDSNVGDGYNCLPGSIATSSITTIDNRAHKMRLTFIIPEHVLNIDTYLEAYTVKQLEIGPTKILGIRTSLLSDEFLVNFREISDAIIEPKFVSTQYKLTRQFKILYKLNHVQKVMWDQWSKRRRCLIGGFLYDVFVDYEEAKSVLKQLASTSL